MPAMTREAMFHHIGMVYFNSRPLNEQTTLQRSFERLYGDLEGLGLSTSPAAPPAPIVPRGQQQVTPTPGQQPTPAPGRNRTSLTQRFTEALSGTPAGMTIAQVVRKLNAKAETIQNIATRQVTTGAYVKEGNKYRIGTAAVTPAPAQPAAAAKTPSPRNRARSGANAETATDRVANLVQQRPGITKAEVISAMAPARPNHVGIWLARLCTNNRITGTQGGKDGPYYPTPTTQRAAA